MEKTMAVMIFYVPLWAKERKQRNIEHKKN